MQSVPTQVPGLQDAQTLLDNQMVALQDGTVWQWRYNDRLARLETYPVEGLRHISRVHIAGRKAVAIDDEGRVYVLPAHYMVDGPPETDHTDRRHRRCGEI